MRALGLIVLIAVLGPLGAVDAGNLWNAARAGLLSKIDSPELASNVPASLRDPENRWFGLTVRARTIMYNTSKVKPAELSTYEALGDSKWKGRLCLRTSGYIYNQSLLATMIKRYGEARTEEIARSWAATKDPAFPVLPFWANQQTTGTHVNVSGAGVTSHEKNRANAIKLLEFLSTAEAQQMFADVAFEYPANPQAAVSPLVAKWGKFKQDDINIASAGEFQAVATRLADRAGYKRSRGAATRASGWWTPAAPARTAGAVCGCWTRCLMRSRTRTTLAQHGNPTSRLEDQHAGPRAGRLPPERRPHGRAHRD